MRAAALSSPQVRSANIFFALYMQPLVLSFSVINGHCITSVGMPLMCRRKCDRKTLISKDTRSSRNRSGRRFHPIDGRCSASVDTPFQVRRFNCTIFVRPSTVIAELLFATRNKVAVIAALFAMYKLSILSILCTPYPCRDRSRPYATF